jgi:DNA-binding HxlR family transcriptional regulator/putative sterol carrier protein
VRELMTGPKRYKDLLSSLSGIGTNLLAERLKFMEEEEIVQRRMLPPPASTEAYDLTDRGRELEPVLLELVRWGHGIMGKPGKQDVHRAHWNILAMKAVFDSERARGMRAEYEYRIDGTVFHARVEEGRLMTGLGPTMNPDFVLETDTETFVAVISGETTLQEAIDSGRLSVDGDLDALRQSADVFDLSRLQKRTV